MYVNITFKNGFGGYKTIMCKVFSKAHFNRLLDKFYNVVEVTFDEEQFETLKDN